MHLFAIVFVERFVPVSYAIKFFIRRCHTIGTAPNMRYFSMRRNGIQSGGRGLRRLFREAAEFRNLLTLRWWNYIILKDEPVNFRSLGGVYTHVGDQIKRERVIGQRA